MRFRSQVGGKAFKGIDPLGGTLNLPLRLLGEGTDPMHAVTRGYADAAAMSFDASTLTGTLPAGRLPAYTGSEISSDGSGLFTLQPTGVAAGSYAKVQVSAKGRVVAGDTLVAADIPTLTFSKVVNRPTTLAGYGITDVVSLTGGEMTGPLSLTQAPTAANQLANKAYVDSKVTGGGASPFVVGDIVYASSAQTPSGFLHCNGAEVSKTTYAGLYAVIGDNYSIPHTVGQGQPWLNHYGINATPDVSFGNTQSVSILSNIVSSSCAVVTKGKAYIFGGYEAGYGVTDRIIYSLIDNNGSLGAFVNDSGAFFENVTSSKNVSIPTDVLKVKVKGRGANGGVTPTTVYNTYKQTNTNAFGKIFGTLQDQNETINIPIDLGSFSATRPGSLNYGQLHVRTSSTGWTITTHCNNQGAGWLYYTRAEKLIPIQAWIDGSYRQGNINIRIETTGLQPNDLINTLTFMYPGDPQVFTGNNGEYRSYSLGLYYGTTPFPTAVIQSSVEDIPYQGSHSSIVLNGQTYTFPGGYGGAAVEQSWVATLPGTSTQTAQITVASGGNVSYEYAIAGDKNLTGAGNGSVPSTIKILKVTARGTSQAHSTFTVEGVTKTFGADFSTEYFFISGHSATPYSYNTPTGGFMNISYGPQVSGKALPEGIQKTCPVVYKNRLYLLGGGNESEYVRKIYSCDIDNNGNLMGFIENSAILPENKLYSNAVVIGNKLYILPDVAGSYIYYSVIDENGNLGQWNSVGLSPTNANENTVFVIKSRLYIFSSAGNYRFCKILPDGGLSAWTTVSFTVDHKSGHYYVTNSYVYHIADRVYKAAIQEDGSLGSFIHSGITGSTLYKQWSSVLVTENKIYSLGGEASGPPSSRFITIQGGLNDYMPFIKGLAEQTQSSSFALPDLTTTDIPGSYSYIKY